MRTNVAVGHNLGARHPFYDEEIIQKGQSGGIMDYGQCALTGNCNCRHQSFKLLLLLLSTHRYQQVGWGSAVRQIRSVAHVPRNRGSVPPLACIALGVLVVRREKFRRKLHICEVIEQR